MKNKEYNFNIKFNKDSHSLNAETYAKTLLSMDNLVKEVGYQFDSSLPDVSLEVVAEKQGSFDIIL